MNPKHEYIIKCSEVCYLFCTDDATYRIDGKDDEQFNEESDDVCLYASDVNMPESEVIFTFNELVTALNEGDLHFHKLEAVHFTHDH